MSAVAFVDCDDTLFVHGKNTFLPGAIDSLLAIQERGDRIVFFTARPLLAEWLEPLADAGVDMKRAGYIHKPLADAYYVLDDKLDVARCDTKMP